MIHFFCLQMQLIKQTLANQAEEVDVKSVDSFQGREKEVVILSLVRSNREGKI